MNRLLSLNTSSFYHSHHHLLRKSYEYAIKIFLLSTQSSVEINGINLPIHTPTTPLFVPSHYLKKFGQTIKSPSILSHFKWMAQKVKLGQDFILIGPPSPFRRHLLLSFAELLQYEIEYVTITNNTTESDLKQRREIVGNSVKFINQPPVKAAIKGRMLILDGLENAERNVLPTLNNLLENREMALEDGNFLMNQKRIKGFENQRLIPVHENFLVVALGLPIPPYPGRTLDPPLRSRFQSRFIEEPTIEDIWTCVENFQAIPRQKLESLGGFYQGLEELRMNTTLRENPSMIPTLSLDNIKYCLQLLRDNSKMSVRSAISRSIPLGYCLKSSLVSKESLLPMKISKLLDFESDTTASEPVTEIKTENYLNHHQSQLLPVILADLQFGRHVCLLGAKGCGKSYMITEIGNQLGNGSGKTIRIFPLFQELTTRDLLQRRSTVVNSDSTDTTTTWIDSPLITSGKNGDLCVLDGIDRIDPQCLLILRRLIQDGEIELPNGEKLLIHPDFRILALGLPPVRSNDTRSRYITSDLGFTYHFLPAINCAKDIADVMKRTNLNNNKNELTELEEYFLTLVSILQDNFAKKNTELQISLRHVLRCQSILKKLDSEKSKKQNPQVAVDVLKEALLVRFLSPEASAKFDSAVRLFFNNNCKKRQLSSYFQYTTAKTPILVDSTDSQGLNGTGTLTIGNVTLSRRKEPELRELVPDPLYFDNPAHSQTLESISRSISTNEKAILLIGNQGVGKNKLIDRLLHLWNAEREYVQVHRDTTIPSLTVLPLIENGKLIYEDSPLIRAVKSGRVLILDEVDKAPLEVVCVLKGLVSDGELLLNNGQRILSLERAIFEWHQDEKKANSFLNIEVLNKNSIFQSSTFFHEFCQQQNILPINPDFRLFCLANPPGHPFMGNQFYKECGDLFICHVIENLDIPSELNLLRSFAPNVHENTLQRLAKVFSDLRKLHKQGCLSYPFSVREAVAVAKHLQAFPEDSMDVGAENIIGFDGMNPNLRELIAGVFRDNGFDVPIQRQEIVDRSLKRDGGGAILYHLREKDDGTGTSNPRTGSGMPKHGKIDPKNKPHVGGNQWAGGTGGSDTAGLGGRGGPYRLDSGHKVHQLSDEEKAKVSKESREKASKMAKKAFEERLKEIQMGENDYQRFVSFSKTIQGQVQQLKDILDEICRRGKERIWVRNQSVGELDDDKIVDGLSGERNVFKKRGYDPTGRMDDGISSSRENFVRTKVQFVVDVSGSMYRFNGYDGRLERMLETTLMILQSLPRLHSLDGENSKDKNNLSDLIEYSIVGHSGDTSQVTFVEFPSLQQQGLEGIGDETDKYSTFTEVGKKTKKSPIGPLNEKDMLQIMERMVAHSQYCLAGDNTLPATKKAIRRIQQIEPKNENIRRLVIVVSDANFARYGIQPQKVHNAMIKSDQVQTHMVMIGGLHDEAQKVVAKLPVGRGHTCMESSDLPSIFREILTCNLGI